MRASDCRPARPRRAHEHAATTAPAALCLLLAMTLVSFGGPFVILVVLRGGTSAEWPPDRPVEWVAVVTGLRSGRSRSSSPVFRWGGGIAGAARATSQSGKSRFVIDRSRRNLENMKIDSDE